MEYLRRALLYSALFQLVGIANGDVDMGTNCDQLIDVDCTLPLDLPLCENADDLSGYITSPGYPQPLMSKLGKYTLVITSCPESTIELFLTFGGTNFDLGPASNTLTVGNGVKVSDDTRIPPPLKGEEPSFPGGSLTQNYLSSGNSMWVQADLSSGFAVFRFQYRIIPSDIKTFTYNEPSGWLNSTRTTGKSYPTEATEERHLIDVSTIGTYLDITLTVELLDISGVNGDYIKIGPGLDYTLFEHTALLSWTVNKGYKFVIEGPTAHLRFVVNQPIVTDDTAMGFAIHYEAVDKILTTPVPSTTPEPTEPTPLPFDPDVLKTSVVFYDFQSNSSAQNRIVNILDQYASSSGMLENGQIYPPLTSRRVYFAQEATCYHGWNVDLTTCALVEVMVACFYQKPNQTVEYAFPKEVVQAAIRQYGLLQSTSPNDLRVTLPEDLLDVYWVTVGIAGGVVAAILLVLLIIWRYRVRREYVKQKKYLQMTGNSFSSNSRGEKDLQTAIGHRLGLDNPTFVLGEEEDTGRARPVTDYDPESLYGSASQINRQSSGNSRPSSFAQRPIGSPNAVVTFSPQSNRTFEWPTSNNLQASSPSTPTTRPPSLNSPKRVVSTSPVNKEFKSSIQTAIEDMDDMEDVVLYDVGPPAGSTNRIPPHRHPKSSPSTVSSDASFANPRSKGGIVYGVYLNDFRDTDDSATETNL